MKEYTTPVVEKVTFSYEEHVVATSRELGTMWDDNHDGTCINVETPNT